MVTQVREIVELGEIKVTRNRSVVYVLPSVGSGVAISLYDQQARVGAVAHIILPEAPPGTPTVEETGKPAKFADLAIPILVDEFTKAGGQIRFAMARMIGGAQLFNFGGGAGNTLNTGTRTATAIRSALTQKGIVVDKTDLGGNKPRQMRFIIATGQLFVKAAGDKDYML